MLPATSNMLPGNMLPWCKRGFRIDIQWILDCRLTKDVLKYAMRLSLANTGFRLSDRPKQIYICLTIQLKKTCLRVPRILNHATQRDQTLHIIVNNRKFFELDLQRSSERFDNNMKTPFSGMLLQHRCRWRRHTQEFYYNANYS